MNPDPRARWRGPRWAMSLLLACMSMLAPFAVDTYLPAFGGIAADLRATPLQMQQTLSAYLLGFAVMNLFHGALSDSLGRRPVVLAGISLFTLASAACALAPTLALLVAGRALQGLSAGAGVVISRAVIRDLFPPAQAQRVMSQVTIWFGIAPAIAPLIGALLLAHAGWRAIFWLLAAIGVVLAVAVLRLLPESLPPAQRHPFALRPLLAGYRQVAGSARFVALALASAVPFNGMFVYVLSAPVWLGGHLRLAPTQFFWFFLLNIAGIMGGAWMSGRVAGRLQPEAQMRRGFRIMTVAAVTNVLLNMLLPPHAAWALWPVAVYSFGWALMTPVVTILLLDQVPERRGMAASLQAFVGGLVNAAVAGALAPLVMDSTVLLAVAALAFMAVGLAAWHWVRAQPARGKGLG